MRKYIENIFIVVEAGVFGTRTGAEPMDVLVELLKLTVATKLAESTMKVVRHGAALLKLLDDNLTHGYIAVLWVWEESQLMQMMADRV